MTDETDDQSVLGSLPARRATRIGGERGERSASAKPKATAKPKPAAKPKAANGKPSAKPKTAAAKATAKPKAAKPKVAAEPRATAKPKVASEPRATAKPRPVRAGAPSLAKSTQRARTAEPERGPSPPSGTELVTTAIQAAGELAQIGLAVGGQVLRRAVGKLPKP